MMNQHSSGFFMRLKIRFFGAAHALELRHERVEEYDGGEMPGVYVDSRLVGSHGCISNRLLDPEQDIPKLEALGIPYMIVGPYRQRMAKQEPV